MIRPGCSASAIALRIFATAKGSTAAPSVFTRMPRSAPMASAVRMVAAACCGPIEAQTISVALPASLSRIASSTAISSNGFIDILTLPSSTPEPSALTRIFTSLSTARLTGTRIFMAVKDLAGDGCLSCFRLRLAACSGGGNAAVREPTGRSRPGQRRSVRRLAGTAGRYWLGIRAIKQRDAGRPYHHEQDGAGDQTADMGPIGNAVVGAARGIDELPDRPATDEPIGPQPKRNEPQQARDLGTGPEQQIRGYDAGDGAGSADQSGRRARIA